MTAPTPPTRPLRSDAQANRRLLLAAARELFAEQGVDVAMAEIARRAGVSNGTLYNRFPTRADLIEAVFVDRLETMVGLAEHALTLEPWEGFASYLASVCELQAADRGFNEVAARGLGHSAAAERLRAAAVTAMTEVIGRAQRAGALRADLVVEDLAFVVWSISRTVEMTADTAPRVWRRHLALMLDGFRTDGAHPLPEPPLATGHPHGHA